MRAKNVVSHLRIRGRAKLVWSRITLSRLTTAYFLITAIHCFIQIILQSHAFSINAAAANNLWALLVKANQTQEANGVAVLANDLRICYVLPNQFNETECKVIWSGNNSAPALSYGIDAVSTSATPTVTSATPTFTSATQLVSPVPTSSIGTKPIITSVPVFTPASSLDVITTTTKGPTSPTVSLNNNKNINENNGDAEGEQQGKDDDQDGDDTFADIVQKLQNKINQRDVKVLLEADSVSVSGLSIDGQSGNTPVILSDTCIQTLIWPVQKLDNTKREDITLIAFQLWVMSMSIVALLNESIPHLFAAVVTQSVVAIWTIQQIFATQYFRSDFNRLTVRGACAGHNILGSYWTTRKDAEIASAVLNVVDALLIGFLTYKLVKIYSWQTYKRIGASLTINRIYKLVLCLSVAIQLALFFIVVAASLWLDQLYHGPAARLSTHKTMYEAFLIIVAILLVPWLTLGWFAIRREMRKSCAVFLILNVIFILVWALLYASVSFRWTFVLWSFFAAMSVAVGILIVFTLGLALACRLNFGKGLPQYLNAQEPVDGVDFTPVFPSAYNEKSERDPEKVDFPSFNHSPSTFSVMEKGVSLRVPEKAAHQRAESNSTMASTLLVRTDSNSTQSSKKAMEKRMVIE